jgi:hypothetical protein
MAPGEERYALCHNLAAELRWFGFAFSTLNRLNWVV